MNFFFSQILAGSFFTGALFLPTLSIAPGPDSSGPKMEGRNAKARSEAWDELTPEQREKLRQALRDVWADPAVIAARAEVKQASDAYQAAVKAAVSRSDPSIADALAKIQRANSGIAHEHISGRPPLGMGPKRGFEDEFKPPGFLDSLPPESREKFRKAEAEAVKAESVVAARAELEGIREEDETLRSRRLEAYRRLRKAVTDEMVRIDPSIAELQKQLSGGDRPALVPNRKKENAEKRGSENPKEEKDSKKAE